LGRAVPLQEYGIRFFVKWPWDDKLKDLAQSDAIKHCINH